MLAPSKRSASFYTLPVVVVIGLLLVAGLAAWQRADVIADLADQVAHGDKAASTAAVRQLAAIPSPPLSVLVEAATSDEHATAEAAQVAINQMLGKWQRQADKKQRIGSVASQLTELAAALAEQRRAFATTDFPWLASTTRKIVRLANKCPAKKTPLVALHCDEIMSVIGRNNASTAPIAGRAEPTDDGTKKDAAAPGDEANHRESRQAGLERDFSAFPTQRLTTEGEPGPQTPPAGESNLRSGESGDRAGSRGSPVTGEQDQRPLPSGGAWSGRTPSPNNRVLRPDWSLPIFRILPAMPIHNMADKAPASKSVAGNSSSAASNPGIAANDMRRLLERWQAAKGDEIQFVEHGLATHGFKRLSKPLVEQYLSDDLEVRLHLVDSVLTEPGVDARPWLLLLADDENAEVRLLAVTIMATSDDKTLVEKAWQVAIRDRDPRIADLAGRLRERRGGALLR